MHILFIIDHCIIALVKAHVGSPPTIAMPTFREDPQLVRSWLKTSSFPLGRIMQWSIC